MKEMMGTMLKPPRSDAEVQTEDDGEDQDSCKWEEVENLKEDTNMLLKDLVEEKDVEIKVLKEWVESL